MARAATDAAVTTRARTCSAGRARSSSPPWTAPSSSCVTAAPATRCTSSSDADGWYYGYLHINDDSPGTDDGANRVQPGLCAARRRGGHVRPRPTHRVSRRQRQRGVHDAAFHFEIRKPATERVALPGRERQVQPRAARLSSSTVERCPRSVRRARCGRRQRPERLGPATSPELRHRQRA